MDKIVQDVSILRQKCDPVASVEEAAEIIERLKAVLAKTDNGVGLAANQIGINKQVGVIKCGKDENGEQKYYCLINPEVESAEDEFIYLNEGCLSLPGLYLRTKRYKDFVVRNYVIRDGELQTEIMSFYYSTDPQALGNDGLVAIAVQHEIDHFNGLLITDHDVPAPEPVKSGKKVGRNEPCPCGSGKKYKKCCLDK